MKLPTLSRILGIAVLAIFVLSSCSKSNQQAFQKRKYMPWFAQVKAQHDFKQKQIANEERVVPFTSTALVVEKTPQLKTENLSLVNNKFSKISERIAHSKTPETDVNSRSIGEENQKDMFETLSVALQTNQPV